MLAIVEVGLKVLALAVHVLGLVAGAAVEEAMVVVVPRGLLGFAQLGWGWVPLEGQYLVGLALWDANNTWHANGAILNAGIGWVMASTNL